MYRRILFTAFTVFAALGCEAAAQIVAVAQTRTLDVSCIGDAASQGYSASAPDFGPFDPALMCSASSTPGYAQAIVGASQDSVIQPGLIQMMGMGSGRATADFNGS